MTRTALGLGVVVVLAGCGASGDWSGGETASFSRGMGSPGPSAPAEGPTTRPGGGVEPGTLTAGAWDDNRNFEHFSAFREEASAEDDGGLPPFTEEEHASANVAFPDLRDSDTTLDVALVVDTTGSMGDEIRYLQAELDDITTRVAAAYPGAQTRWALVLYKDEGDEYVVRVADFTSDTSVFRSALSGASATGGGDYPEAVADALEATVQLEWRLDDDTARLAFWVADAPHQPSTADRVAAAVRVARDLDVHVYPVASSGVNRHTELTMRASAQLTGGRYLFLTDDSGVGGTHLEPSIPCYFVTLLGHAMLRMVDVEMTGVYREPAAEQVIRTGGDPSGGVCRLASGRDVRIF